MKKGVVFLLVIFVLLICGSVGYYMYKNLIEIQEEKKVQKNGWCLKVKSTDKSIKIDGRQINIDVSLSEQQLEKNYNVEIKNCGSIDAYLYDIVVVDEQLLKDNNIIYEIKGIKKDSIIKKDEIKKIKIGITYENKEDIKEVNTSLDIKFNFYQYEKE